LKRCTCVQ